MFMKTYAQTKILTAGFLLVLAGAWPPGACRLRAAEAQETHSNAATVTVTTRGGNAVDGTGDKAVVIKTFEPTSREDRSAPKDQAWLGVATEETSEALTAQLGLDPGVGLVVTYLDEESPATKAGLQKNDVLAGFDDQTLVHPAQLRKLVQAHKEGDVIKLTLYRAGKKQTVTATLAKARPGFGRLDDAHAWPDDLRELRRQLRDLPISEAIRKELDTLRESLGHVKFDHQKVEQEVRHSMEEARKAMHQALRQATNAGHQAADSIGKVLKELDRSGVTVDNHATVTVQSSGQAVKSFVKTDDTGAIILVSNPKLHLTAHDPSGKLLFDGEIETPDQRARVPRDLWERVEPLLEKMAAHAEPKP